MTVETKAPTPVEVVLAIARREIAMAARRKLVKLLFLGNLIPPIVMAVILVVNMIAEGFGLQDLGWDPLVKRRQIQTGPVFFLALGIGTPLVARARSEDVLFLYATRPVTPWSYTIGKIMAIAIPAVALLVVPGILIAVLRAGLIAEFGVVEALTLLVKIVVAALLIAWAYAGVTVGASAAVKKARWALLLAFMCFMLPNIASEIIWRNTGPYALDPGTAGDDLVAMLFGEEDLDYGVVGAIALLIWGALGSLVTSARVRREMIP